MYSLIYLGSVVLMILLIVNNFIINEFIISKVLLLLISNKEIIKVE